MNENLLLDGGPKMAEGSKLAKCRRCVRIFFTYLFSHVGLCAAVTGYAVLGAFTFESLEQPFEINQRNTIIRFRDRCREDLWNITDTLNVFYEEQWKLLVEKTLRQYELDLIHEIKNEGYDGMAYAEAELQWSFPGALLYCITVITTIGYGNIAPKTDVGKIVTIFYALLGIPMMLLCLTNIGDLLARSFKFTYFHLCFLFRKPRRTHASSQKQVIEHMKSPMGKAVEVATLELCNGDEKPPIGDKKLPLGDDSSTLSSSPTKSNNASMVVVPDPSPVVIERVYRDSSGSQDQRVPMYMVLLLVTGYICGGAVLFSLWEKWTFLNGAYFCFITLSTIGFGDLVPGSDIFDTQSGQAKLIICCLYLIMGLAIIAMSFNLVQEEVIIKCKNVARNLGLLKSENDDDDD
ncbi:TWiK family of potassium channels protein 7-like isoform X2 [Argiope bruennichi]|uniref:TWiK family of potassium channels protein 7-like isoform X2 n=1 Tax=Argiope bruennichi TaxID=94029 RepID=UPI0024947E9D|nr:TWiK family of potassium channels protein 7-like isoform X2 [Argiope bruennichi]